MTPQQFVATWKQATLKERSAAQPHFIGLCHLIGHPTPEEDDPSGAHYTSRDDILLIIEPVLMAPLR
ncbi:MAG: hypothetical protein H7Z42_22525, partial [Roseiflexaceae bacterium]|nr:hypothetical protein [Roseiflexaceae bacterium]